MNSTYTLSDLMSPAEQKGLWLTRKKAYFTTPKTTMEPLSKSNEMNKKEFMQLLGKAYGFPDYFSLNLDSAEEIIEDLKEEGEKDKLSLMPFFYFFLAQEQEAERAKIRAFLADHFVVVEQ